MILKDQKGAAFVELVIVLPLILLIVVGILQFGWLLNSYIILANATAAGARFFAAQGGSLTANANTITQVTTSASALNGSLTITTAVAGSLCTDSSTPTCSTALIAGQGNQATVTVSYTFSPLIMGSLYVMPTTLNYTMAERVMAAQSH